jgi:hypothetical protein
MDARRDMMALLRPSIALHKPSLEYGLPPLVLGCATYSSVYGGASPASLYLRMTRLALRYGITAFDTAPHYHPSEIILGKCLYALRDEFPREKYSIITKCGKYSPRKEDHVLEEGMLRACVERSLRRFMTDYLDVVCKLGDRGEIIRGCITEHIWAACRHPRRRVQLVHHPTCGRPHPSGRYELELRRRVCRRLWTRARKARTAEG